MNVDPSLLFAIGGALVSVGVAFGAHTITVRMLARQIEDRSNMLGQQISNLQQRWIDANATHNEQLAEMRGDLATHEARLELNAQKVAVLEVQVGSLRAMRAVRPPKGDAE